MSRILFLVKLLQETNQRNYLPNICTAAISSFYNSSDDLNNIFQAAKIRAKILKRDKWLFGETFQWFTIPQGLQSFLHWIITAPKHALDFNCVRKEEIEKLIDIVG